MRNALKAQNVFQYKLLMLTRFLISVSGFTMLALPFLGILIPGMYEIIRNQSLSYSQVIQFVFISERNYEYLNIGCKLYLYEIEIKILY